MNPINPTNAAQSLEFPAPRAGDFSLLRTALCHAESDAQLLDGRNFDRRYWINMKSALTRIERELVRAVSERDALKGVIDG